MWCSSYQWAEQADVGLNPEENKLCFSTLEGRQREVEDWHFQQSCKSTNHQYCSCLYKAAFPAGFMNTEYYKNTFLCVPSVALF